MTLYSEWLAYGSDSKRIAEAFTRGINAYVALTELHPQLLPPEFALLGYLPSRWDPADVVRIRTHGIMRNVANEVRRAKIACLADLDTASYWGPLEPAWSTKVPDGLDVCDIPDDVLAVSQLARAAVRFPAHRAQASLAQPELPAGSNNWTIAPSRTSTGRPILANDPHRGHSVPSLRYVAHLVAPDLNVIGAGEPALPGLSIGHNAHIAFGLTVFGIDQEDLYVYRRRDLGYAYRGQARSLEVVQESIPVRGAPSVDVELKYTRHGPVIFENEAQIFAIRGVWSEPGTSAYFGSIEYMRAESWREFSEALNRWGTPAENQVYADVQGNIGYKPAGTFPRRQGWDGLLPVPGDGRYEWDGFHDMDVLPVEFNPERGFTGTANSMNLPVDYPIERYTTSLDGWADPWRYDRMWSELSASANHSIDDSIAMQQDVTSRLADAFITRLPNDSRSQWVRMLKAWDRRLHADSPEGALYIVWLYRHLRPALSAQLLPDDAAIMESARSWRGFLRKVDESDDEELLERTLAAAASDTAALLGDDTASWRWGALHQARFEHPLYALADRELRQQMQLARHELGGSGSTLRVANFDQDFSIVHGASFSMVLDVGNWDASRMTNTPGQSGDPRSPFYDNLLEGWAKGETFPLLYSRKRIAEHEALTILLHPVPQED